MKEQIPVFTYTIVFLGGREKIYFHRFSGSENKRDTCIYISPFWGRENKKYIFRIFLFYFHNQFGGGGGGGGGREKIEGGSIKISDQTGGKVNKIFLPDHTRGRVNKTFPNHNDQLPFSLSNWYHYQIAKCRWLPRKVKQVRNYTFDNLAYTKCTLWEMSPGLPLAVPPSGNGPLYMYS